MGEKLTNKELQRLTRKWLERLRLLDWDVYVRFAKKGEHEDVWGIVWPMNETKEATIIIADPKYMKNDDPDSYEVDTEVTIVHECLHLHFAPFNHDRDGHEGMVEEVIVSALSQLLVALDRRDETVLNPLNPRWLSKVASFHGPLPIAAR